VSLLTIVELDLFFRLVLLEGRLLRWRGAGGGAVQRNNATLGRVPSSIGWQGCWALARWRWRCRRVAQGKVTPWTGSAFIGPRVGTLLVLWRAVGMLLWMRRRSDYDEEESNDANDNAGWERKKDNDGRVVEQPGLGPPSSAPPSTSPAAVTDESRDDNMSLLTLQKIHPGDYDKEQSNDDNDNAGWEGKKDSDGRVVDVDVEQPDLGPPSFASRSTSPSAVTDESRDDNTSSLTLQKSHPGGYDEEESNDDNDNAGWEGKKDSDGRVVDVDVEQPDLGPPSFAWINNECGNHSEETTPLVMEAFASFGTTACGMLSERKET
jgi:hypothetical protein